MKRLIGSLCAALMVTGLSACGVETPPEPEQAPQVEAGTETHLHSERGGIGLEPHDRMLSASLMTIDPRRSLAVTDRGILTSFPVRDVFNQLAAQGGGYTGVQLFRQLWDTQNARPGQTDLHAVTDYGHCTDNNNTLNGFPYSCREPEGGQATSSTSIDNYTAVGLYNRFDLAPANGANCGEYRIVFARNPDGTERRNFIIFEAVLPNPNPVAGIEGCRAIANFWRDLSDTTVALATRAARLRSFYFEGRNGPGGALLSPIPVIHIDNYGNRATNSGQVRTNMFMGNVFLGQPWLLHEFKLQRACSSCAARFMPVTVKTNPFGPLFEQSFSDPRAAQFRSHFLTQVASLAVNNVNTFNYVVPDTFNAGESDSQNFSASDNYLSQFGLGPSPFRDDIQARLTAIGSTLTPNNIVTRAQALSCAGCHNLSAGADLGGGISFPRPHQPGSFVHSTEFTEQGPEGERFQISPALTGTFLTHRQGVLASYLDTPVRNAAFVSQSVPTTVTTGQSFTVSITMKNTGTNAWTAGQNFRLGSQSPQDNTTWGLHRVFLASTDSIHQGQTKQFVFTVTAPSTPGVYAFKWGMLQELVTWFGTFSPTVNINVVAPTTTDPSCSCPPGAVCPNVECPINQ